MSLGCSPGLVFALHRCCHQWWCWCWCHQLWCAVFIGMLPSVGCTVVLLVKTSSVFLKLRENNSWVGPGGVTSQPRCWSPLSSPHTHHCGIAWLLFSLPLPPWSCLGGGGCFCHCCTSHTPGIVMVPICIYHPSSSFPLVSRCPQHSHHLVLPQEVPVSILVGSPRVVWLVSSQFPSLVIPHWLLSFRSITGHSCHHS